jgi:hypothetical protein
MVFNIKKIKLDDILFKYWEYDILDDIVFFKKKILRLQHIRST